MQVGDTIFIYINNLKINYELKGDGKPIILLHGWGANLQTFSKLADSLSNDFKVFSIDLPGFGESDVLLPLNVDEVADIIHEFVILLNIDNPIILGHSYGGRVGICYASKYRVCKLVLVSSAGIKQKLNISKRLKIKVYKMLKKCHFNVKMGSNDFLNADNVKKIMLIKAVNTDLKDNMKLINIPTLLIYGKDDSVTPLSLGYDIKKNIIGSSLIEIDNCGHFPYLERFSIFLLILNSFLLGDSNDQFNYKCFF